MDRIPIIFEHEGKSYTGHFSNVMGARDTSTYHLLAESASHKKTIEFVPSSN